MLLEVLDLNVYYGAIHALQGISFNVDEGEIVTLIGANGAGKSTTLKTVSGLLHPRSGQITLRGEPLINVPAQDIVRKGIIHVPEGRKIFAPLTVAENLEMGAFTRNKPAEIQASMERVFKSFPRLKERLAQLGGTLSGGEQQMLAIGRALMGRPKLLLLDEPSMGLAPLMVEKVFEVVRAVAAEGMTILLVEQNATVALAVAHSGYIMENGKIVIDGTAERLANDPDVREFYLGMGGGGEAKSFKDIKHYKRRKRWLS